MDLHRASDYEVKPTVEEIKKNHIADLEVQNKYGVKYLQYYINEEDGLVFCLIEGPNKQSCAAVHQEAHGNMPCNIIELKGGDYNAFMGEAGKVNDFDIVEQQNGLFDSGYRTLLALEFMEPNFSDSSSQIINHFIQKHGGRKIENKKSIVAVFNHSKQALDCTVDIQNSLSGVRENKIDCCFCVCTGEPVSDNAEIFGTTIQLAHSICEIGMGGQILISSLTSRLIGKDIKNYRDANIRILTFADEQFLIQLIDCIETLMGQSGLKMENICKSIGMSRAQLYRKISNLTGKSPNQFILEMRLRKSLRLLKENYGNIAQITYEVGLNSPSYFAKLFQKRFNYLPSDIQNLYFDSK